ncbi:MAG: hypothetical protein KAX73_02965 [Aquabacterium sp.]|nr:hypothetical protein [Aquabacterium sp.]
MRSFGSPQSRAARVLAAATLLCAASAQAGYYTWETVTLPASSGAACGDGSPYRVFVNKALFSSSCLKAVGPAGAKASAKVKAAFWAHPIPMACPPTI